MTPEQAAKIYRHAQSNPSFFFERFLGVTAQDYQLRIAESVRDHRMTTVRSSHEVGKSWTAARVGLWFLVTHKDSILVTTAPTARQVEDILWREINTAYNNSKVTLGGRCLTTKIEFSSNWYGVGLSTTEPEKFQGYHSDSGDLLVITDEAAGIPEVIFVGVKAIMTSRRCRLLMIGNPTSSSGTFRNSHSPDYPANKLTVSMFDTPNFRANGITNEEELIEAIESERELLEPAPFLVSPIWGYEALMEWGPDSPLYQARALGIFPDQGDDTLIPLSWILAAMTKERNDAIAEGETRYGVDVARFGTDRTVILKRKGDKVTEISEYAMQDTMQTAGRVMNLLDYDVTARAYIDVIGLGAGVVDRTTELQRERVREGKWAWTKVVGVNVAEKPEERVPERELEAEKRMNAPKMKFKNKRAQLYWRLRGKFERHEIALPDTKLGQKLAAELSEIQYRFESDGSLYIEEKKDIKKRLLKSPDLADALMLSFAGTGEKAAAHVMPPEPPPEDRIEEDIGPLDFGEPIGLGSVMDTNF